MNAFGQERVIKVVPQHWVRYLSLIAVLLLVGLADVVLFVLAGVFAYHVSALSDVLFGVALVLLLLLHHWAFAALASESMNCIIITNHRVVSYEVRLLFYEELKEVAFEKMKAVDVVMRGFWRNLLRYGALEFEEKNRIDYVPHPNRVVREIEQAQGLR